MAGEGIALEVVKEERPLGTAGAVRNVLDRLDGTTIVFNGDVLTDLDLGKLIAVHGNTGAAVTLALSPVPDAGPYGLVPLDESGRVQAFVEKPPPEVASLGGNINAGTYVLEPGVLADIPAGEMWSFERQVFPPLLERGVPVFGLVSDAYWMDIGTPERYLEAHWDVLNGVSRASARGRRDRDLLLDEGATVGAGVVGPAALGPGARIEDGATVERVVILDRAVIEAGAVVRDSVLGPGAVVAAGARCEGRLLGADERAG
jgi:mannose-1-phosphate guanylyltransferase